MLMHLDFLAELQTRQGVHALKGQRALVVHFPENVDHDPPNGCLCIPVCLYGGVASRRLL